MNLFALDLYPSRNMTTHLGQVARRTERDVPFLRGLSVLVFGGYVRDLIAGLPTGDIDIVADDDTAAAITERLTAAGFSPEERETDENPYKGQQIVLSLTRLSNGDQSIDIIATGDGSRIDRIGGLLDHVSFVDLVCCGVAWHPRMGLLEVLPGAVRHCMDRILVLNPPVIAGGVFGRRDSTSERIARLTKRGWTYTTL